MVERIKELNCMYGVANSITTRESLEDILAEMAAGCVAAGGTEGETFFRVPDRLQAIYFALTKARPGDIVLACGKVISAHKGADIEPMNVLNIQAGPGPGLVLAQRAVPAVRTVEVEEGEIQPRPRVEGNLPTGRALLIQANAKLLLIDSQTSKI